MTRLNKMPVLYVGAILFLMLSVVTAFSEEKDSMGEKLAVVNGIVITKAEVDRKLNQVKEVEIWLNEMLLTAERQYSDDTLAQIKRNIVETMIDEELMFQESQKKGITVEAEDIARDLKNVKNRLAEIKTEIFETKINEEVMFQEIRRHINKLLTFSDYNLLLKSVLTEAELRSSIEREYAIDKLIYSQITALILIPDQEIRTFYDTHPKFFKKPEQVRASHILIKVDPQAEKSVKDEKRAKLQEVQKRLKLSEDFAVLAKEISECPSSIKGGDLGYFERGKMAKPFEDVAFRLKTGEVSDIVETRFGYHLIKVVDKRPASVVGFNDVKDKIGQYLKKQKTHRELKGYIEELRKKAVIERVTS